MTYRKTNLTLWRMAAHCFQENFWVRYMVGGWRVGVSACCDHLHVHAVVVCQTHLVLVWCEHTVHSHLSPNMTKNSLVSDRTRLLSLLFAASSPRLLAVASWSWNELCEKIYTRLVCGCLLEWKGCTCGVGLIFSFFFWNYHSIIRMQSACVLNCCELFVARRWEIPCSVANGLEQSIEDPMSFFPLLFFFFPLLFSLQRMK